VTLEWCSRWCSDKRSTTSATKDAGAGHPALDFQPATVISASASCAAERLADRGWWGDAGRALAGYDFRMSPRDPRLQAAALRLAAERVERGEALAPELADALANDMASHPEDLAAIEAHEGPLPQWMAEELDRRDREDAGTEDDGDAVMARLLVKHSPRRQSA
jgi:hypothetical protein